MEGVSVIPVSVGFFLFFFNENDSGYFLKLLVVIRILPQGKYRSEI